MAIAPLIGAESPAAVAPLFETGLHVLAENPPASSSGPDLYTFFTRARLRARLDGTPPPMTPAGALTVLRTVTAAYEAAETRRTVRR